jgi:structural maintenance of chromosome 1
MECIQYMKEQRVGVATFIPLDKIKVKPLPEKLRMLGGTAKPVLDLIQYDPSLQKAVLYAVGHCLCCETLEEAKKLAFSGRERYKGHNFSFAFTNPPKGN